MLSPQAGSCARLEVVEVHGHELVGQGTPLRHLPPVEAQQAQPEHAVHGVWVTGTQHTASSLQQVHLQCSQSRSIALLTGDNTMLCSTECLHFKAVRCTA